MKRKKTSRKIREARRKLSNGLATLYACSTFLKEHNLKKIISDAEKNFRIEQKVLDN